MGGSFGGVCGLLLMSALPSWDIQPGVYAMCASAAVLGGVFRSSISLVVLLVEGTQVCCVRASKHLGSAGVTHHAGRVVLVTLARAPALACKDHTLGVWSLQAPGGLGEQLRLHASLRVRRSFLKVRLVCVLWAFEKWDLEAYCSCFQGYPFCLLCCSG